MTLGTEEILNRFGTHKPTVEGPRPTSQTHAALRLQMLQMAGFLDTLLPEGRYKSMAFTELEAAAMWAHKAVASQAPVDQIENYNPAQDATNQPVEETYRDAYARIKADSAQAADDVAKKVGEKLLEADLLDADDPINMQPQWVQDAESAWQGEKGTSTQV